MKCNKHPALDATAVCAKCGKGLCIDCKWDLESKTYCHTCAYNIPTQNAGTAFTLVDSNDRRTNGNQGKVCKLLKASKICVYLAFMFAVIVPSCFVMFMNLIKRDIPNTKTVLGTFLFIGIALFLLAAICRIIALINQRVAARRTEIATAGPSEDIKRRNAGLSDMKCINHTEHDAARACAECGKNLCVDCIQELYNKTYCQPCAQEVRIQVSKVGLILDETNKQKTAPRKEVPDFVPVKSALPMLLYNPSGFNALKNEEPGELDYLSLASLVCAVLGLVCYGSGIFTGFISFISTVTSGNSSSSISGTVLALIVLDILAVILGVISLFYHRRKRSIAMSTLGILLGLFPLIMVGIFH